MNFLSRMILVAGSVAVFDVRLCCLDVVGFEASECGVRFRFSKSGVGLRYYVLARSGSVLFCDALEPEDCMPSAGKGHHMKMPSS